MKRSEAIKFITDILFYGKLAESVRLGARKNFITNLAEEDAEAVLKELEKLGMRPPFFPPEKLSVMQDEKKYTQYYRWEPEDEEK